MEWKSKGRVEFTNASNSKAVFVLVLNMEIKAIGSSKTVEHWVAQMRHVLSAHGILKILCPESGTKASW